MKEELLILSSCGALPIGAELAGISYCDGSYFISRVKSDVTVIEYVLSGEGTINCGGATFTAGADTVYILKKGSAHSYRSSAENPWVKIFINLSGDLAVKLLEEYNIGDKTVFSGSGTKSLFLRAASLVRRGKSDLSVHTELAALYLRIIAVLCTAGGKTGNEEAARLKNYLDGNLNRIVKNSELAASVYRSPDYTVKLFAAEYGTTPYEYQLREKMSTAKRLLKNTAMPVSEIAAALGYNDPQYFSGLFRRRCGMPPSVYRKKNKANGAFD